MDTTLITKDTLDNLGIDLSGQDETALLAHLNQILEERIGTEITDSLDETKLTELVELQENASDEAVSTWLEANIPELAQIAQDEADILLGELAENSHDISNIV